jgi:propanediol utilization protein
MAMTHERASHHGVNTFVAVLKASNFRSLAFLSQLGFVRGSPQQAVAFHADHDELVMVNAASATENAAQAAPHTSLLIR